MMRALIAMSGGVDSAVAAMLAMESGYECEGVTLLLREGGERDALSAAHTCAALGIPHRTFELTCEFSRHVVRPFIDGYLSGVTPNPCVECNRNIKLGALLDYAVSSGFDRLVTGHYAVSESGSDGITRLKKAADTKKDQSYVLYTLPPEKLKRVMFPLGAMTKNAVRALAAQHGLMARASAESQDICFIPDGDYAGFIAKNASDTLPPPGDFIDTGGRVIGRHDGHIHYTVGQRRGLGVSAASRLYVIDKDAILNTVTLGSESELLTRHALVKDIIWHIEPPRAPVEAAVRPRYHACEYPAVITPCGPGGAQVAFAEPVRRPAPGQAAVFYLGDTVLGGGTFDRAPRVQLEESQ